MLCTCVVRFVGFKHSTYRDATRQRAPQLQQEIAGELRSCTWDDLATPTQRNWPLSWVAEIILTELHPRRGNLLGFAELCGERA
jgi:hypothetical protein